MNTRPRSSLPRGARRFGKAPLRGGPRVLLLASGLGYGHVRAAQAIEAALLQHSVQVQSLDLWALMHPAAANIVHQTYLRLVQEHPDLYERLYHLDERTWRSMLQSEHGPPAQVLEVLELISGIANGVDTPEFAGLRYSSDRWLLALVYNSLPFNTASLAGNGVRARLAIMKWAWMRMVKRIEITIDEVAPDVVVCTQMIPAGMVSVVKRRRKLQLPMVAVLTDFGVHDFWGQPGIDRYCVAHASMADAFSASQREAAVLATGVPLMPGFSAPLPQAAARQQIGLPSQGSVVLVLGGGLGLSVDSIAAQLVQARSGFQFLIMPGRNQTAQANLAALAAQHPARVKVCDWTDRMDLYVSAADVIVGKPGGITVAEALACGRPLFATRSLGGQEGFNVRFLEGHGVGALLRDADLLEKLESVMAQGQELAGMQARARALGRRDGAARIAEMVLDLAWQRQRRASSRGR
jgi:processive 1,2-diacylglycerol beta-glucosyltransferase